MGLSILKTKLRKAMLDIPAENVAVQSIPSDADVVVTNVHLKDSVQEKVGSGVLVIPMDNFLDNQEYDKIIKMLKEAGA